MITRTPAFLSTPSKRIRTDASVYPSALLPVSNPIARECRFFYEGQTRDAGLYRMHGLRHAIHQVLVERLITSHRRAPRAMVIDFDGRPNGKFVRAEALALAVERLGVAPPATMSP